MIAQKKKFEFTTKFATLTLENPFKSKEGEDKIEEDEHDELAHSDIKNK